MIQEDKIQIKDLLAFQLELAIYILPVFFDATVIIITAPTSCHLLSLSANNVLSILPILSHSLL